MFFTKSQYKKINIMLMIFICKNLLPLYICCSVLDLFLYLLTTAISSCAFVVTQWFCPVCIKHHSCTWLGISLFGSKHLYITLDMFYIIFIVIVDSWNINKISISIYIYITHIKTPTCLGTQLPFSGRYNSKGVRANLLILDT